LSSLPVITGLLSGPIATPVGPGRGVPKVLSETGGLFVFQMRPPSESYFAVK